jgi:hypothetical protein
MVAGAETGLAIYITECNHKSSWLELVHLQDLQQKHLKYFIKVVHKSSLKELFQKKKFDRSMGLFLSWTV